MKRKLRRLLCIALVAMLVTGVMSTDTVITAKAASVSDNALPTESGGDETGQDDAAPSGTSGAGETANTGDVAGSTNTDGVTGPTNTDDVTGPTNTDDATEPADTDGTAGETNSAAAAEPDGTDQPEDADVEEEPASVDFADMTVYVKGADGTPSIAVNGDSGKEEMAAADEAGMVYWYTFDGDLAVSSFIIYDESGVVVTAPDETKNPDFSANTSCFNKETGMWESFSPMKTSDLTLTGNAVMEKGDTIYFDANGNDSFLQDGAVPYVGFKFGTEDGDDVKVNGEFWQAMELVDGKTDLWFYTLPETAVLSSSDSITYAQFRRSSTSGENWKSGTSELRLEEGKNCLKIYSWNSAENWYNDGEWVYYEAIEPAVFAGETVYVISDKGTPQIQLMLDGVPLDLVTMTAVYGTENVYRYTFAKNVAVGTVFSIINGERTEIVSGKGDWNTNTPCYDEASGEWIFYEITVDSLTFRLDLSGSSNAYIWGMKGENRTVLVSGVKSGFNFTYTSEMMEQYDGIQIGWYDGQTGELKIGNLTKIIETEEIINEVTEKGASATLHVGEYVAGVNRSTWWTALNGDPSLNIPAGSFRKDGSKYYVSAVFYDYYSDEELNGNKRNELTGGFSLTSGGDDKIQARYFNLAVSQYFESYAGTDKDLSNTDGTGKVLKPLYFGEFESMNTMSGYYRYDLAYNNGTAWSGQAHQNLVDQTLNSDKNITMNGIELPYFDAEFLRGGNTYGANLGMVFDNVQFPFTKNSEGYWEFDSREADQTLRMKRNTMDGLYFLENTGATEYVHGTNGKAEDDGKPGFFPFNDHSESANAKQLNYGFGMRMDIPFRMTEDGMYTNGTDGSKPITFDFSGDDDVWIFIDGELVLDIGGDHGRVSGSINFADEAGMRATVYYQGSTTSVYDTKTFGRPDANQEHVLTMFYMERGLWESNIKITFNFPLTNQLSVEKQLDTSNVNPDFVNAIRDHLSAFEIVVKNLTTRGDADKDTDIELVPALTYHTADTDAGISYAGTPEVKAVEASYEGRTGVLHVKYADRILNPSPTDVARHRVAFKPADGSAFNAAGRDGYLQFYMRNEGTFSAGTPYVDLKDGSGHTIGGWAVSSVGWQESNNTLSRGTWVTVKIDLEKLQGASAFDWSNVTEVGVSYWDNGDIYIDDITFHQGKVEFERSTFETPQDSISTYGSVAAKALQLASGAIYSLEDASETSADIEYYVIDTSGLISLRGGKAAYFLDQFRLGSYLYLEEQVNADYYNTSWALYEGADRAPYRTGSGAVMDDGRTEETAYTSTLTHNGAGKPSESILFRSNSTPNVTTTPLNIRAVFTNEVKTGSLTIKKEWEAGISHPDSITFTVYYNNIFGQINLDTDIVGTYVLNEANNWSYTVSGVPVGTAFRIVENIPEDANYALESVTPVPDLGTKNEDGSYIGTIWMEADWPETTGYTPDVVVTFKNAAVPEEENKVFYVETGKATALPMNLTQLIDFSSEANPVDQNYDPVALQKTQSDSGDGTDIIFDSAANKTGVVNTSYTFTYNGISGGKKVTGKVTVYTYHTSNDIYVFDYGLKSDLADVSHGDGMFQNDFVFNDDAQKVDADKTTASFAGLRTGEGSFGSSAENTQSKITAGSANLSLIMNDDTDAAQGAKLEDESAAIYFEPTAFMDKEETVEYRTTVLAQGATSVQDASDGVEMTGSITVMPASVVYYEDNFVAITGNGTETAG
ncbi:MAG: hypothetical protein Q4C58_13590, partial [Eubacteriales bacterium]|nr:hypothetical protein [Eubacteriales bacterium]